MNRGKFYRKRTVEKYRIHILQCRKEKFFQSDNKLEFNWIEYNYLSYLLRVL